MRISELIERAARGDEAARERLVNYWRNHRRQTVATRIDRRFSARVILPTTSIERLRAALQEFSSKYREVLAMRRLERLDREIAASIGIKRGAFKSQVLRAVDHVRERSGTPHD